MMKRILWVLLALCLLLTAFTACKKKNEPVETENPNLKWKEIADRTLTDEGIEDLDKYIVSYADLTGGGCSVKYAYALHGYETEEAYMVNILANGTVDGILQKERDKYTVFEDLTTEEQLNAAREKVEMQAKASDQEGTVSYYLIVDEDGYLCMRAEIYVYFDEVETNADGEELVGCGVDHDHILFTEVICAGPTAE